MSNYTKSAAGIWSVISTVTVAAGGAASVDFTGIASGFKELRVVVSGTSSASDYLDVRFNNDSGANQYKSTVLAVTHGGVTGTNLSTTFGYVGSVDGTAFRGDISVNNATGTLQKVWIGHAQKSDYQHNAAGYWVTANAEINRITIYPNSGTFNAGVFCELLGRV